MKKIVISGVAATTLIGAIGLASANAATPSTWNQTVQVTSSSVITLTTTASNPVTIPADPTINSGFASTEVPLTLSCNDENGATVTLSMIATDANNGALFDDGTSAPLTTTDVVAPIGTAASVLTANTWGYNVVNASTNTAQNSTSTFSPVPAAATPATLLATSTSGTSQFFVNFGALVDYTLDSGITYSNQVTYTASANP
ncbi:hypothetical protein FWG86_01620 [Candidatus Saccharibacteria bacterium]|nr:hypothetical protein [Candidatus Saccharibacteria bacterium]